VAGWRTVADASVSSGDCERMIGALARRSGRSRIGSSSSAEVRLSTLLPEASRGDTTGAR